MNMDGVAEKQVEIDERSADGDLSKEDQLTNEEEEESVVFSLKRHVGLVSGVNFMLSFVLGTGIFVTPGAILAICGSVGMTLLIWVMCGVISFLTCLPFGELSTVIPKSGMIYSYLLATFNHMHPFFGGLPAFTFFCMMYVIILPCSTAVACLLFSDYTFIIVGTFCDFERSEVKKTLLGASILFFTAALNCYSVKVYVKSQDILTYIKMIAIYFIVGCGIYLFLTGKALKYDPGFDGTDYSISAITRAIYFGLYSYDGGSFITTVTEEMKNPEKNIFRSVLIGLTIITTTYVMLNVTFLTALTPDQIANSTTVTADFSSKLFGDAGAVVASFIICLAFLTCIMSGFFCASRMGYVAAKEGHVMEFLCYIHKSRHTPAPSILAQLGLSLGFYFLSGGIAETLIHTYTFFIWLAYGMTMACLLLLRKQRPDAPRPFRVPTCVPVLVALLALYLFGVSLLLGPMRILIVFLLCVSLSTILYFIFVYKRLRFLCLTRLQQKLQRVFGLVTPTEEPPI